MCPNDSHLPQTDLISWNLLYNLVWGTIQAQIVFPTLPQPALPLNLECVHTSEISQETQGERELVMAIVQDSDVSV